MIEIRPECREDEPAVYEITKRAFRDESVAALNDRLRSNGQTILSLVAHNGREVVGHAMFARVTLVPRMPMLDGSSLGPIAVMPDFQGRGIGRKLVEAGLSALRGRGFDFVMLLGSPKLYPRFGFAPGKGFGLTSNFEVPDDEFMVVELRRGALVDVEAKACFAPEFDEADRDRAR